MQDSLHDTKYRNNWVGPGIAKILSGDSSWNTSWGFLAWQQSQVLQEFGSRSLPVRMWHHPRDHERGSDASCASHGLLWSLLTAAMRKGWMGAPEYGREGLCCLDLLQSLLRSTGNWGGGIRASCCCSPQKMLQIFICFLKAQNVANKLLSCGRLGLSCLQPWPVGMSSSPINLFSSWSDPCVPLASVQAFQSLTLCGEPLLVTAPPACSCTHVWGTVVCICIKFCKSLLCSLSEASFPD